MTKVIMLHESVAQSWARDASTFALFACLIGVGVVLDSSAMQWTGAMIGFITVFARAASSRSESMTISEARAFLDALEEEGVQ